MKYLIVSGGDVNDRFLNHVIKGGSFEVIIAVDAGMDALYRADILPDMIVGDFDSANLDVLDYFRGKGHIDICMLEPEKDDTDTEHAIRDAIQRGADDITIIGGTGRRIDHLLANIAMLGIGLEEGVEMRLLDQYNQIRMIDAPIRIRRTEQFGRYISLLPYTDQVTGVTLKGMKYPLCNYTLEGFRSLGISNEIVEDEAVIELASGKALLIESRD